MATEYKLSYTASEINDMLTNGYTLTQADKEDIANLISFGAEGGDVAVNNAWEGWTVYEASSVNSSGKLVIGTYSTYTTYTSLVAEDTNLWFGNYPSYTCITTYPKGVPDTVGDTANGAIRYRTSDGTLPVEGSALSVPAGYAIAVTVNVDTDFSLYGLAQGEEIIFSDLVDASVDARLNSLKNGKIAVKFINGTDCQRMTVYHAANGDYCIGQIFERVPNTEKNSDVWHLKYAYICDSKTLEQINTNPTSDNYFEGQIVNNGEWENAIQEVGQDDWMGGTLHGDEIMTSVHFFLDGKQLDLTSNFTLYGDELKVIGITELYRVNDNTVKVVDRSCVWTFRNGEIIVAQTHKFAVDVVLAPSYTMMFPINKMYSETFLVNGEPALLNYPKESTNRYEPDFTINVNEQLVNMFGNGVVCEVFTSCNQAGTWFLKDNGNEYNKIYFNIGNKTYSAGDTICTKTIYQMRLGL